MRALPAGPQRWGPFAYVVCFPDGNLTGNPLPHVQPEIVLDARDLVSGETLAARIEAVLKWWPRDRAEPGRRGAEMLIQALAHDIEIRPMLSIQVDAVDREIIRLSSRQYGVLQMLSAYRRVIVSGPAGSGKTLVAVEKARRLDGLGFKTLLTCFNRPLADYLRCAQRGLGSILKETPRPSGASIARRARRGVASGCGVGLRTRHSSPVLSEFSYLRSNHRHIG